MCNTENITYQDSISKILSNYRCISCHNASYSGGGIRLDDYFYLKQAVDAGSFLGSIEHDNDFRPMPFGEPKMNQCDIDRIKGWIDEGALNN
jgi:hypothetical protein